MGSSLKNRLFILFYILPLGLSAIYLYVFSSDVYVSEAKFIIRQEGQSNLPFADFGFLAKGAGGGQNDSQIISALIHSMAMLEHLDNELPLKEHYSSESVDYLARLDSEASREGYFNYYLDRLDVIGDDLSSIITLKVHAYSPEISQKVLKVLLDRSEEFVNEIGYRLAREQMKFMRDELANAEARVNAANEGFINIQNQHDMLSPEIELKSRAQIIVALEAQLSALQTELKRVEGFLNKNAPEMISLVGRIQAIERQLESERKKQTAKVRNSDIAINEMAFDFQRAQQDVILANGLFESTLASLETARLDASRKVKHLVVISPPNLPEEPLYPRRLYILTTLAAGLFLMYGLLILVIATIEDHRE